MGYPEIGVTIIRTSPDLNHLSSATYIYYDRYKS
jgi:hypothetical protein